MNLWNFRSQESRFRSYRNMTMCVVSLPFDRFGFSYNFGVCQARQHKRNMV